MKINVEAAILGIMSKEFFVYLDVMYSDSHQKEEFSVAYVHAVAALAKCNVGAWRVDSDSVDISLRAFVPDGKQITHAQIDVQLKCTDQDVFHSTAYISRLKKRTILI